MAMLDNFRVVVFRAVAGHLSFRKAAEELYLTQSAVSQQIKALEEELGIQLFDRSGTHVVLTEAGKILWNYSGQASALLAQAVREMAALSGDHAGVLALGASTTIAQYLLPRLLCEFLREHPRVRPTIVSGNTEQIVEAIENGKIELGLIEGPARCRHVVTEAFQSDELVLIVPLAHEWADRECVTVAELATAPLLMRERGSGTRNVLEIELARHGLKRNLVQIAMELDSTEAIKSSVEAGLGVGFVSRWSIAKDQRLGATIKVIRVEGVEIQRKFQIVFAKGPEPSGVEQEFRRFLQRHAGVRRAVRQTAHSS